MEKCSRNTLIIIIITNSPGVFLSHSFGQELSVHIHCVGIIPHGDLPVRHRRQHVGLIVPRHHVDHACCKMERGIGGQHAGRGHEQG